MSVPGNLSTPLRGALWMLFASASYVVSAILTRQLGDSYSAFELTFIRSVIAVIVLAPLLARAGRSALRTRRIGTHLLCGLSAYTAILLWFFGAAQMPVAEFFALQFTTPLFTIALAMLLLRERDDASNWMVTLAGFAGVLIILRPGLIEVTLAALATLTCSACYAGVNTVIKTLTRTEPITVIVFYTNLLIVPLSLPMAVIGWKTPSWADWPLIAAIAVLSTVGFLAITRAITLADARVVQPVNFMRLPIAAALGFVFFRELPDMWTWVGAVIVFACAYFVVTREARAPAG